MTLTSLRKLPVGSTVCLSAAPHVRFVRGEDKQWHEVPRFGIAPRVITTASLFLLGVEPVS